MVHICGVAKRYPRVAPPTRSGRDIDVILRDMSNKINDRDVRVSFAPWNVSKKARIAA